MIAKSTKNPNELIQMDEETLNRYVEQADKVQLDFILNTLDILTMSDEKAKWSTQPRIILEMAIIQIVKLEQELSLEDRIKRLEMGIKSEPQKIAKQDREETPKSRIKEDPVKSESPKVKEEKSADIEAEASKEVSQDNTNINIAIIQSKWKDILQVIKKEKMNVYALLIEGKPSDYQNGLLTIGYQEPYGFHKEAVNSVQNKEFVENTLSAYFNAKIEISLKMEREGQQDVEDEKKKIDKSIKNVIGYFGEDLVEIE